MIIADLDDQKITVIDLNILGGIVSQDYFEKRHELFNPGGLILLGLATSVVGASAEGSFGANTTIFSNSETNLVAGGVMSSSNGSSSSIAISDPS